MKEMTAARTVYILLTRSETCFSKLIRLATEDDYTHVSIGLEGLEGPFYSFARKEPDRMLPAGLVEERADHGFFSLHPSIPCCLYALEVSQETYQGLEARIEAMYAQRERYSYNLLGALTCFFQLPLERQRHYFCSQFVAELLSESGAVELPKPPALTRPSDFCRLERLRPLHRGRVGALAGGVA